MSAIDMLQRCGVAAFQSVLHQHKRTLVQLGQVIQQFVRYAIRACANHNAHDILNRQRLFVQRFQLLDRSVCIRKCLEVSQVLHVGILMRKKLLALGQLRAHR